MLREGQEAQRVTVLGLSPPTSDHPSARCLQAAQGVDRAGAKADTGARPLRPECYKHVTK